MENKFREFQSARDYQNQMLGLLRQGYGSGFNQVSTSTLCSQDFQIIKEKTLFQEIAGDVKGFIRANRGIIYFLAFALLVDHFIFKGVFKARLQAMVEKLVTKVESKINE
jgi:hypothetical protein